MARLPVPGGDPGSWGGILNDFLTQVHNADGTLKAGSVGASQIQDGAVSESLLDSNVQTKLNATAGSITSTSITDSTGTGRALLTAANPAAAKTVLSLSKSDVGLANVDNTSDATKNSASGTLTNKIISGSSNTLSNINLSSLAGAGTKGNQLRSNGSAWVSSSVPTYYLNDYGADPTGSTSSNAAVAAAMTAMGSNPGILEFGPGTYQLSSTITLSGTQGVKGQGIELTTLSWTGTGDCIRLGDLTTVYPPSFTGFISGFKIEGLSAGAPSTGIHAGDLYGMRIHDVWICDLTGAGSIGLRLENTIQHSERAKVSAIIDNCTTCVVMEHSDSGDPSFSYSDWDFSIKAYANQDGVVMRNSIMTHSTLTIRGNCFNCNAGTGGFGTRTGGLTDATTNTGVGLTLGATDSDTARIQACQLFIGLENGGQGSAPSHTTLNIGADAFLWASGIMNFFSIDGSPAWEAGTQHGWMSFAGLKNIDTTFGATSSPQTLSYGGALTGGAGYVNNGAIHLESGNAFIIQLTNGNNTFTFETNGSMDGFTAYELLLIQPGSGAPATVTLPNNAYAVPTALSLTTTPNEVDVLRVYTFDHSSYFVVQLTSR